MKQGLVELGISQQDTLCIHLNCRSSFQFFRISSGTEQDFPISRDAAVALVEINGDICTRLVTEVRMIIVKVILLTWLLAIL